MGPAVWTTASLTDFFWNTGWWSFGHIDAAGSVRQWIAFHCDTLGSSLLVGLLSFFALSGLRRLVKRDLVAATIAAVFFTFSNGSNFTSANWQLKTVIYLFIFSVLLTVLLRYGLVTIIAACFFIDTFDALGLGADWKTWYAPAGLANAALLAGIAVYAFARSQGVGDRLDEAAG